MSRPASAAAAFAAAVALLPAAPAAARTWHVRAGAADGDGSRRAPLGTLARAEAVSRARDTIVVLPATAPLTGGIRLKPRQRLIGAGPAVTTLAASAAAPTLTNPDRARLDGDAVRLADGVTVRNLRIAGTARGGIYGDGVTRATITGNDVSGHNRACVPGFLIPPFNVPLIVPGAGIPISDGLQNGWAGIMVDAARGTVKLGIRGNHVHDAECGDGIDVRASGTASVRATIAGNDVADLREGESLQSVLAIGLQARERSRLVATVDGNRQSGLGNDEDAGIGPTGADSEGVFVNLVGGASMRVSITRNRYTHVPGRGGFSANGLEFVSMGDGGRALVDVRDSSFSRTPGDVIEQLALGTNATLRMRLTRVVARDSTGFAGTGIGDTVVIPGNDADCVIAASGGAGNTVDLRVRDSTLTNCANNGVTVGSAVANGTGATNDLRLDLAGSTVRGNHGGNLRIGNVSALRSLSVRVEDTDLSDSRGQGSAPADVFAEDLGSTDRAVIDLGGGALGSRGGNCLVGGPFAIATVRYTLSARGNWWGVPGGLAPGRVAAVGGTVDAGAPLGAAPRACG